MKIIDTKSENVRLPHPRILVLKDYKPRSLKRECNLCAEKFTSHSKFDRFCEKCRTDSELYHFAEWLTA